MPAQRPVASFEPIPPDLDLDALVEQTPNFKYAPRIPCEMIDLQGMDAFEKLVLLHVVNGGKPLVVEGFQDKLDPWTFSTRWLRDNVGKKFEQARVLNRGENMPLSISHYLEHMNMLTNQWSPQNFLEKNRQRLYLKDIDCPELWHDKLREEIPRGLFYLNESVGDIGGVCAMEEPNANGVGTKLGRGAAKAGDLMSCLPPSMRAENLMCYVGHEGTYTPAHREMCASLGQNIMVETSGLVGEDGKPTKPGSSVWFMTESNDRRRVAEYWLSALGHDIEVESHFAQINAWKRAPFTVYIVEQKVGDFILIPPLAPHQVWNRGTRTMKVAWNRTTVETLDMALNEALPNARMVCRDEQYKNKAIVLFTLNRYSALLNMVETSKVKATDEEALQIMGSPKIRQLEKDFRRLFKMFTRILVSEMFSKTHSKERCEYIPYDSNITCSYCRCNIFNRFLTCKSCIIPLEDGEEDTYDICMECYIMGRSCKCRSRLTWVEQFPWKDLVEKYEIWRQQVISIQGVHSFNRPSPLDVERKDWPQKTLAEMCQEQLHLRPYRDPNKEDTPELDEEDDETETNGTASDARKKKPRKQPERWYRDNPMCHTCMHRHTKWKTATCSCGTSFCYGALWRGFDLLPQKVMEPFEWKCPKCQKRCSCSSCAKVLGIDPYKPSGTILGHDTRKFADPRSLEHLVDFSSSNMYWVKKAGDDGVDGSQRMMLRKQDKAAEANPRASSVDELGIGDGYPPESQATNGVPQDIGIPLDPQLTGNFEAGAHNANVQAAQTALSMMNGLSQLEQDPHAFIAQAGLQGPDSNRGGSADYEYPDPNTEHLMEQAKHGEAETETQSKKRKRGRDLPKVQSDAADDVNTKFQKEQAKQSLEEAKKQGRLISARAAITGHKKVVILRLPPSKLGGIVALGEPEEPTFVAAEAPQSQVLVESDLPPKVPPKVAAARNPQVPKKRRRGEVDEDFTTSKAEMRAVKRMAAVKLAPEAQDVEVASDSELDVEEALFVDADKDDVPKRRSLPAYLARRSPVDGTQLPKELSNSINHRAPRPSKSSLRPNSSAHEATTSPVSNQATPNSARSTIAKPADAPAFAARSAQPLLQSNGPDDDSFSESTVESHIEPVPRPQAPMAKMATKPSADENQKAKLRALGELSDSSSTEDSEEVIQPAPSKRAPPPLQKLPPLQKPPPQQNGATETPTKRRRGRPPKSAAKSNGVHKAVHVEPTPKKSIFSKFGPGKVKIMGKKSVS